MPKGRAEPPRAGPRRGRRERTGEAAAEGCRLSLVVKVGFGIVILLWAGMAAVNLRRLELQSSSGEEALLRPWRERVTTLEASVAHLERELASRDGRLRQLTGALAGGDGAAAKAVPLLGGPLASLAASVAAAGDASPNPAIRGSAAAREAAPGGAPPPAAAVGAPSGAGGKCTLVEGVDYASVGKEDMVPDQSAEQCCDLCASRNKALAGSCSVGVLSAKLDNPPLACWLKEKVAHAIRKEGVVACWPPGHGPIPQPHEPAAAAAGPGPPVASPSAPAGAARGGAKKDGGVVHVVAGAPADMLEELAALALGPDGGPPDAEVLRKRAQAVRKAVKHAWDGYTRVAWGFDELRPVARRGVDGKFKHAVTMIDALDTLWIVGLKEEFNKAKEWLADNLPAKIRAIGKAASVFETTIRSLGGLLSAYELSKDPVFLDLSKQLGHRIVDAIKEGGIAPYLFGGGNGGSKCRTLAESGTTQLELRYLAHVSGDDSFRTRADEFYRTIQKYPSLDGLWPNCFQNGKGTITFGADGDSFYEYLLKVWLQGGRKDDRLWSMYKAAANALEKYLLHKSPDGLDLVGVGVWNGVPGEVKLSEEMEHLACFVPGWLGLGAQYMEGEEKARRMDLAESIAFTCWRMYERQPTGIGPERVKRGLFDLSATDTREYILRPEALEAWWYMHELTGKQQYREWGWKAFQAFEKHLWVPSGYASLKDVRDASKGHLDRMESFFLAETLKYAYLLQDPDHEVKLDRYVMNTEAHPLPILGAL